MSSVRISTANWCKWTRLDSSWLQRALFDNHLFVKVGQLAGLDFCGNQIYGASCIIEPLDFAFGNLFTNTVESFNPARTPGVQVCGRAAHNSHVTAASIPGNRNPYQQDATGLSFVVDDSPDFLFEAGYTHRYENPAASGRLRKIASTSSVVRTMAENSRTPRESGAAGINQALYRAEAPIP